MRYFLVTVVALLLANAFACSKRAPTLEVRAQSLEKQIICPVCPGETLDQSGVQIAKDMRALIRERLAGGDSEQEIRRFFVDRYGTRILAEPPTSGLSLAVWLIPPAGFIVGSLSLYLIVREMRRRPGRARAASADAADPALEPYLHAVDVDLTEALRDADTAETEQKATEGRT